MVDIFGEGDVLSLLFPLRHLQILKSLGLGDKLVTKILF